MRTVLIAVALLTAGGIAAPAMGAQLSASVNPGDDASYFSMKYLKNVGVQYPDGGQIAELLRGHRAELTASVGAGTPESDRIAEMITSSMLANGSQARVQDIDVEYTATLRGGNEGALIDYKVEVNGTLAGYVIRPLDGSNPAVVDMGWRDMSIDGPVMLGGAEINMPMSFIEAELPGLARAMAGSEAEALLRAPLMDSSFILTQPLTNWHSLFDPTGISVDASLFGISDEIAGFVVTEYTMGESSFREGIQIETKKNASFAADREYNVRTTQSADNANIGVIGFAQLDTIDGLEIVGVFPTAPANTADTSTGDFPVFIMYGMAGVAAVGAVAFFAFSSRQMKKEQGQGQTGIDPSRLVGRQTSESSGGYHTNRGEAQLAEESQYQRTRSVYDDPDAGPQPSLPEAAQEAACGCASSAEMGSECDCQMQGSCLCDASCACSAQVCAEHARTF